MGHDGVFVSIITDILVAHWNTSTQPMAEETLKDPDVVYRALAT